MYRTLDKATVKWNCILQGQTPAEIAGLARAMREKCVPVFCGSDALDIVGTGGDGIGSVNISTGEPCGELD